MNTPTPTNDEWIVTDNMNYIEIASTQTRDSIASVHGGKTVGEQYDLAGRIAKVPQLERELTAMTEQRNEMAEILRDILAYDKGDKPHDYWALQNGTLTNAMAFDAWQEILRKIEQALETKP